MNRFLVRLLINAASLWVAVRLVPGLTYDNGALGIIGLALVFGVVNAIIRPIISILTCPLILITLGLFTLVINALMLWLAGAIGSTLGINVQIAGFGAAFWGALVVSIVSIILSLVIQDEGE